MASLTKSREIHASLDRVWDVMSRTDEDPRYWSAIRDIKVIEKRDNTIEREATVGPSGFSHRSRQTLTLEPKRSIKLKMIGNPMTGERTIALTQSGKNGTRVDVEWDFELKDVPGFVGGIVKNQLSKATDAALAKIAEEAERAEGV